MFTQPISFVLKEVWGLSEMTEVGMEPTGRAFQCIGRRGGATDAWSCRGIMLGRSGRIACTSGARGGCGTVQKKKKKKKKRAWHFCQVSILFDCASRIQRPAEPGEGATGTGGSSTTKRRASRHQILRRRLHRSHLRDHAMCARMPLPVGWASVNTPRLGAARGRAALGAACWQDERRYAHVVSGSISCRLMHDYCKACSRCTS